MRSAPSSDPSTDLWTPLASLARRFRGSLADYPTDPAYLACVAGDDPRARRVFGDERLEREELVQAVADECLRHGVFLARAYVGWKPNLNWSFLLGKQKDRKSVV